MDGGSVGATDADQVLAATRKADKAIKAANQIVKKLELRSTTEQRKALLEGIYANYVELHQQQEELQNRKRVIDYDLFQSNNKEIHDLLFEDVDAHRDELGDWDTWERVELIVKRCAYGRPHYTSEDRDELAALKERATTLSNMVIAQRRHLSDLERSLTSTRDEMSGLMNLLRMKDRELRFLVSANSTYALQLRQAERECRALREPQGGAEKQKQQVFADLKLLIEANKALEKENTTLRGQLHVKYGNFSDAKDDALEYEALLPQFAEAFTTCDDVNDQGIGGIPCGSADPINSPGVRGECHVEALRDDGARAALLQREIPISAAVMEAQRRFHGCMRGLECEVGNAMEALDIDANARLQRRLQNDTSAGNATRVGVVGNCDSMRSRSCVREGDSGAPLASTTQAEDGGERPIANQQRPTAEEHLRSNQAGKTGRCSDSHNSALADVQPARALQCSDETLDVVALDSNWPNAGEGSTAQTADVFVGKEARQRQERSSQRSSGISVSSSPALVLHQCGIDAILDHSLCPESCAGQQALNACSLLGSCSEICDAPTDECASQSPHAFKDTRVVSDCSSSERGNGDTTEFCEGTAPRSADQPPQVRRGLSVSSVRTCTQHAHSSQMDALTHAREVAASSPSSSRQSFTREFAFPPESAPAEDEPAYPRLEATALATSANFFRGASDYSVKDVNQVSLPSTTQAPKSAEVRASPPVNDHACTARTTCGDQGSALKTRRLSVPLRAATGLRSELSLLTKDVYTLREETGNFLQLLALLLGHGSIDFPPQLASHELLRSVSRPYESLKSDQASASVVPLLTRDTHSTWGRRQAATQEESQASQSSVSSMEAIVDSVVLRVLAEITEHRLADVLAARHNVRLRAGVPDKEPADEVSWFAERLRKLAVSTAQQVAVQSVMVDADVGTWANYPLATKSASGHHAEQKEGLTTTHQPQNVPSEARGCLPVQDHYEGNNWRVADLGRSDAALCGSNRPGAASGPAHTLVDGEWPREVWRTRDLPLRTAGGDGRSGVQGAFGEGNGAGGGYGVDKLRVRGRGGGNRSLMDADLRKRQLYYMQAGQMGGVEAAGIRPDTERHLAPTSRFFGEKADDNVGQLLREFSGSPEGNCGHGELQPIVRRFNIQTAMDKASRLAASAGKALFGSVFDDHVRQAVLPIAAAAEKLMLGRGVVGAPLLTAIRQLRQEELEREKRSRTLLLKRVATSIRTRHLLRHPVFRGDAFASYIHLLYEKWRARLEEDRRRLAGMEAEGDADARVRAVYHEYFEASAADLCAGGRGQHELPPLSERHKSRLRGTRTPALRRQQSNCPAKSSSHFEKVSLPNDGGASN